MSTIFKKDLFCQALPGADYPGSAHPAEESEKMDITVALAFSRLRGFGENVRSFIPRLRVFFLFFF